MLTLQYVPPGSEIGGWAVANLQASAVERVHGPLLGLLATERRRSLPRQTGLLLCALFYGAFALATASKALG